MLSRGASPYDVAKVLADTIETVERHYAPLTKELRERVRDLMNNGEGLEKTDCTKIAQSGHQDKLPLRSAHNKIRRQLWYFYAMRVFRPSRRCQKYVQNAQQKLRGYLSQVLPVRGVFLLVLLGKTTFSTLASKPKPMHTAVQNPSLVSG
jgi:hypothetical protein